MDHMTAAEYRKLISAKESKYHNIKTEYNGVIYDSRKEANRAWELDQMLKAGIITGYERQKTYVLAGGIKYKADFVVRYPDGREEIEDVKGGEATKTPLYRAKKKLMKEKGFEIREV